MWEGPQFTVPLLETIRFITPEAGMWNAGMGLYMMYKTGVALSERALIKAFNSTDCSYICQYF